MSGGYVYVIKFDNGVVKVGRSKDALSRLKDHACAARNLGLDITSEWTSPEHDAWIDNERELMRLGRELGGRPTNPGSDEYFRDVAFSALVARANELSFDNASAGGGYAAAPKNAARGPIDLSKPPRWLRNEVLSCAQDYVFCGHASEATVVGYLTDRVLREDREIGRRLVEERVRKLIKATARKVVAANPDAPAAKPPGPPDPPEPEPPAAGARIISFPLRAEAAENAA